MVARCCCCGEGCGIIELMLIWCSCCCVLVDDTEPDEDDDDDEDDLGEDELAETTPFEDDTDVVPLVPFELVWLEAIRCDLCRRHVSDSTLRSTLFGEK